MKKNGGRENPVPTLAKPECYSRIRLFFSNPVTAGLHLAPQKLSFVKPETWAPQRNRRLRDERRVVCFRRKFLGVYAALWSPREPPAADGTTRGGLVRTTRRGRSALLTLSILTLSTLWKAWEPRFCVRDKASFKRMCPEGFLLLFAEQYFFVAFTHLMGKPASHPVEEFF